MSGSTFCNVQIIKIGINLMEIIFSCIDITITYSIHMISMRGIPADEERVSEIKKLLVCGTFYFAWAPPQEGPPIDLSLAAQKCVKHTTTDFRFFW